MTLEEILIIKTRDDKLKWDEDSGIIHRNAIAILGDYEITVKLEGGQTVEVREKVAGKLKLILDIPVSRDLRVEIVSYFSRMRRIVPDGLLEQLKSL
jgi:hypothetical protein